MLWAYGYACTKRGVKLPAATTTGCRYLPPPSPFQAINLGGGTIVRVLTESLRGTSVIDIWVFFSFGLSGDTQFEHKTFFSRCVPVSSSFSAFWTHHISYSDCFGNYCCDIDQMADHLCDLALPYPVYTYTRIPCRYGLDKLIKIITTSEAHL